MTKSAVVVATSQKLYDEVRPVRPDALYSPNGVDCEHFRGSAELPVPADIADLVAGGRPIIGYYGALAHWFDYELLAHAARVRRDCEFLLMGPDFDGTLTAQPLMRLPNVRWLGEKKYEELPAYIRHFAVATIPFLITGMTKSVSPVKLFEYMAAGKPIVTTDMPECRRYPCVMTAHDAAEYVVMLDAAIDRGQSASYRQLLGEEAHATRGKCEHGKFSVA